MTVAQQYHNRMLRKVNQSSAVPPGQHHPAHKSAVTTTTIHNCIFELVDHLPYSSAVVPSDFHLFQNLKKQIAGTHFTIDDAVMAAVQAYINMQDKASFKVGIEALQRQQEKRAEMRGD